MATNMIKTVAIDQRTLATLVSCAQAHVEDVETGIEEGLYVEAENTDLPIKKAAVSAAATLVLAHESPQIDSAGAVERHRG